MRSESFTSLVTSQHFHSEIFISKRFIHRSIVFVIYEKLNESSFLTNLVTRILARGTKKFLRSYELSRFLYSLYGAYIDSSVTKWGSNLVYTMTIKNLIPEKWPDPMQKSVDLALEMMLGATWSNQLFFDSYFKEEKKNQIDEINDLVNDRFRYAFEQFIQWMFTEESFGMSILGNEKKIKKVNNVSLSEYYQKDFLHQNRMVFFLDKKVNHVYQELITQFSDFTPKKTVEIDELQKSHIDSKKVRRKSEKDQNQQSWIFFGYRFKQKFSEELYPAMILFNNILGGQSNSILYRKVREEKGLCYFVNSSLPAGVEAIIISAGISFKNKKIIEDVILEEISKLCFHSLDPVILLTAKELTTTALYSILDHPFQIVSMKIESFLFGHVTSLKDLIEKVNRVTPEQIQEVANALYLDCVYLLQGTE